MDVARALADQEAAPVEVISRGRPAKEAQMHGHRYGRRAVAVEILPALKALVILAVAVTSASAQPLRIYHIDVDQGDATLFVAPGGNTLLVDCGKNGHGDRVKAVMDSAGVADIDFFVCTHYHEDHYGGIDDLVQEEEVVVGTAYDRGDKEYLRTDTTSSGTYTDYQSAIGERARHLMRGESIPLDPDVDVVCVAHGGVVLGEPDPVSTGRDENDMSIALFVQYGQFRYFIGGDIEEHTERELADLDVVIDVDVYQADHHGSDSSSCDEFMDDLSPTAIVISNGSRADYQHPRASTLDEYASLDPVPVVFQTNKYLRGDLGGNVDDAFIADLDHEGDDGAILLTVAGGGRTYTVSYRDTSITFHTKTRRPVPAGLVIASVLPNPAGEDRQLEEVTLRNDGDAGVSLVGWTLMDEAGRVWMLGSGGTVQPGTSVTVTRGGMAMNLNNDGDHVYLRDPDGTVASEFEYETSREGVVIETGL
jgi:beta-lactamase superfamily II metal-dependent hydrolase